jgi:protein-arginine kinase activator protein McsA
MRTATLSKEINNAAEYALNNSVVEVICPYCKTKHLVEEDADYQKECDNCGGVFKVDSFIKKIANILAT